MHNIIPMAPSDASVKILQDRFNRDVQTSIRQITDEGEDRLSNLETRVTDLETVWKEFYTVEWPAYKIETENRFLAIEAVL